MMLSKSIRQNIILPIKLSKCSRLIVCSRNLNSESNTQHKIKDKYDVIVAGGGMVGCTMACALGGPSPNFSLKPEYSNRVVALSPHTKTLMSSLKVWRHVENMRLQPVRHMQVWDACSDALITFNSSELMDEDVAYIVENDVLQHSVNIELTSSDVKNVDIVYGAKISGYELAKNNKMDSLVTMENGDCYSCKLLIGADGAKSAVRDAMGVQYLSWSYDQMGVVATLELAEETDNTTAWQRFLPTGPIALLPLNSRQSSLVWSTKVEHAKQLLQLPEEQFVDALNDALWKKYPRISTVDAMTSWLSSTLKTLGLPDGTARQLPPSVCQIAPKSRAAFPLGFGHSTRYIAPGVALIGDAAHRVHPLAGQGVNLGFGDVRDLAAFLSDAVYTGLDLSDNSWLEKYETSRQRHNVTTQLAVDALHRLYTLQLPPLVLARSLGLQLTNALRPVKVTLCSSDNSWLQQYETSRQRHNVTTQLAVDALHRLYTLQLPPLVLARSLGLQLTNALRPVKVTLCSSDNSWLQQYETSRQRHNVTTQLAVDALHRLYTLQLPPLVLARSLGLQLTNALRPVKVTLCSSDNSWLQQYETSRQRHNVTTQLAVDALHRLYTLQLPPLVLARSLGLQLTNALRPVKVTLCSSDNSWLQQYETSRQRHNVTTQLAVDALHRLYTLQLPPLVLARSLGLQLTNALRPVKVTLCSSDNSWLQQYETSRQRHNVTTQLAVDALHRLYTLQLPPLVLARSLGLQLTNALRPVKVTLCSSDNSWLQQYETSRQRHNVTTQLAVDALHRLYTLQLPPLVLARSLGLQLTNALRPVKVTLCSSDNSWLQQYETSRQRHNVTTQLAVDALHRLYTLQLPPLVLARSLGLQLTNALRPVKVTLCSSDNSWLQQYETSRQRHNVTTQLAVDALHRLYTLQLPPLVLARSLGLQLTNALRPVKVTLCSSDNSWLQQYETSRQRHNVTTQLAVDALHRLYTLQLPPLVLARSLGLQLTNALRPVKVTLCSSDNSWLQQYETSRQRHNVTTQLAVDALHRLYTLQLPPLVLARSLGLQLTNALRPVKVTLCSSDNSWLQQYETSRQRHNVTTQLAVDALHRLYTLQLPPLVLARSLGLQLTNALRPVKVTLCSSDNSWLQQYETSRQRHNVTTQLAVDALHRLYTLQLPPLVLARSLGLQLTNALRPVKVTLCSSDNSWLQQYETSRQRHNVTTQLAVDALHRLYTLQLPPLVLARSLGLQLTNALRPVKVTLCSSDNSWLQQYETSRQRHNVTTQLAVDALHRLYTLQLPPLVLARSLGLQLTNALRPVKVTLCSSDNSWLQQYETSRQRHNVTTQLAVDALHRLYTLQLPPLVLARSLGLQLTNALRPVKVT